MEVVFHSLDDKGEKVFFRSKCEVINNKIIFDDKSTENTKITITPGQPMRFTRAGNVNMEIMFSLNERTRCYYNSKDVGFDFEFEVYTDRLIVESNRISIEYTMFLYGDKLSSHKIWILLH